MMTATATRTRTQGSAPAPPTRSGALALRLTLLFIGGLALLSVLALVHISQGQATLSFSRVVQAIVTPAGGLEDSIVRQLRLPRVVVGILAGTALATSGTLLQTITRNPLAAPTTLGINAGAFLAIVLSAVFFPGLLGLSPLGIAFAGGAAAAALVYFIAASVRITPVRLILAGVAVTFSAAAITAAVQLIFENETAGLFFWGQGSLIQNDWSGVNYAGPRIAVGFIAALLLAHQLDVFALGDDVARSLGQRIQRVRLAAMFVAVVLAAAAVSVTGPIGFVGLVAPHVARLAGAARHRTILLGAAVWGSILVIGADVFARTFVTRVNEAPVGVITAFIGAPFLVWLVRRAHQGSDTAEQSDTNLPLSPRAGRAYGVRLTALTIVVFVVFVLGISLGDITVQPGDLVAAMRGDAGDLVHRIVVDLRLPRVLVALLSGAALAVSGAVIQGVIRNPLAAPEIVGVTTGAGLGALIVLLALPSVPASVMPLAALGGGALAFGTVYAVSWRDGIHPARLALIGIVVSAFCLAAINLLIVKADVRTAQALAYLAGSTYARSWSQVWGLIAWPAVLIPIAWVGGRQLDLMALGERAPIALGLHLERARALLLGVAVALASAAVAAVGTIGFVGLMAPHAARLLAGGRMRRVIPMAALLGAVLVGSADIVGRLVLSPREIPAGLVTSLVGTPYFVWLMWRSRPGAPGVTKALRRT